MSAPLAKPSQLKPGIRLAQAVSQFEADLSGKQNATFKSYKQQSCASPPDASDVMRLTAEIDRRVARKVRGRPSFGPRLTNVLQAVQQYAALEDIIVGGSHNIIACGVWSVVRMTFLILVDLPSSLEMLSTFLMTVGRSVPRYQNMDLLYPRSKDLQSYLSEYFIVVVQLCHQLLRSIQKSKLGQFISLLGIFELRTYQSKFDVWASSITEEVQQLMAQGLEEQGVRLKDLSVFSQSESNIPNPPDRTPPTMESVFSPRITTSESSSIISTVTTIAF